LAILDEMLCRFEHWARGQELRGVVYRQHNQLTPGQRKALLKCIEVLRQDLRTLTHDLGLETKDEDIASAIWSQSLGFWEAITELGPKYLRRYGELPEASISYLDDRISQLAAHLRELTECLGKR
jgi:hypothetical protein